MANVAKGWAVGDTVWVRYDDSISLQYTPQSRVVASADVNSSTNEAIVRFESGTSVTDGATVRVYTTQALCATGMVTAAIAATAAAVALDATTSGASTSGQASSTLVRSS